MFWVQYNREIHYLIVLSDFSLFSLLPLKQYSKHKLPENAVFLPAVLHTISLQQSNSTVSSDMVHTPSVNKYKTEVTIWNTEFLEEQQPNATLPSISDKSAMFKTRDWFREKKNGPYILFHLKSGDVEISQLYENHKVWKHNICIYKQNKTFNHWWNQTFHMSIWHKEQACFSTKTA